MPEVVYPTPAKNGKARAWNKMFKELPDTHDGWAIINRTLEHIAMNNRFGGRTVNELRAHLLNDVNEQMAKFLTKQSRSAFNEEKYNSLMREYALNIWYINQVFDNLGGAYREYKS